jgi:cbb3-type cytochrome oxidase subunit 3
VLTWAQRVRARKELREAARLELEKQQQDRAQL